jgi:hypothetical protein
VKRAFIVAVFLLFPVAALGQPSNPMIIPVQTAPANCPGALPLYIISPGNSGAGNIYGNTSTTTGTTCSLLVNGSGTGTVTSVCGDGTVLSSGTCVTSSGNLGLANAAQNSVLAGPASGGAAAPTYQSAPTFSAANLTNFPAAPSVANALTLNNSNSGATSGSTYNGSAAVTLSANTLGAGSLANANLWSGSNNFSAGVQQTGTGGYNIFIPSNSAIIHSTSASLLFGGAAGVGVRGGTQGVTSSVLTIGDSYAGGWEVGASPLTTAASGTHAWLVNLAVTGVGAETAGGATVTNSATAYFAANSDTLATTKYQGIFSAGGYATTDCASAASPAVCGAAPGGSVVIPTGTTSETLTVNTTAVTANSRIFFYPDDSLGTKLGVTCNSTLATLVGGSAITARTAGTSFTITFNGTILTNGVCGSYLIQN